MARKARVRSSTGVYKVTLRGITEIFADEAMRTAFGDAAERYLGSGLLKISFDRDRVQMLIRESEKGISMDMKPLTTSFARTFNRENNTTGRVFADRFGSVPADAGEESVSGPGNRAKPERTEPIRPETEKLTEPQQAPPKPKKKNALPSWLL